MSAQDRELLELAARAAGIDGEYFEDAAGCALLVAGVAWNPIRFHHQAKALRHHLRLVTGYDARFITTAMGNCAYATYSTGEYTCNSIMQNIEEAGGKRKALRLSITRAAAEIGRSLKETNP